jgi:DNA-directed RNA polymerase subunit RPC12/RpoP
MAKYACRQCQAIFELPSPGDSEVGSEAKCPKCGSATVESVPVWIPNGFDLNLYYNPSTWQYSCHHCQAKFEMPVPSGPTEEQQRKCPLCGSNDIERLTTLIVGLPMYCS